jgi:hypothetical protein
MLAVMARKLRPQLEGAIYHVMNRGDHNDIQFVFGRTNRCPLCS